MDTQEEVKKGTSNSKVGPISKFHRSANRAQIVPGFIRFGLITLALLAEFYCIFENVGPYYWIANLQAELFNGSHFPALSFLISFMLVLVPAAVIIRSLIPYYERKSNFDNDILDQL